MLWTPVPPALTLAAGEGVRTWEFLAVVGGSQAEARTCLGEALRLRAECALYPAHAQAWAQLWASCGLDVRGPLRLRQALRAAQYYLLSALPPPGAPGLARHGLSPGGLSNGSREECYWGHVFWDQVCTIAPSTHLPRGGRRVGKEGLAAEDTGVAAASALPAVGAVVGDAQGPQHKRRLPRGGSISAKGCAGVSWRSEWAEETRRSEAQSWEGCGSAGGGCLRGLEEQL